MFFESSDFSSVADDINKALSDLSLEEIVTLRNQLYKNEVAYLCDDAEIRIFPLEEIKEWGQKVEIEFTESDDLPETPVSFWIDGTPSDISFESELEALIYAFERNGIE
jgi:hypothetical protein